MRGSSTDAARFPIAATLALAVLAGAGFRSPAAAQAPGFPRIPIWSYPYAFQDAYHGRFSRNLCPGSLPERSDSLRVEPRTVTVRFLRDRFAEARADFGGYRIYRCFNSPDSTRMELIRRFSRNPGDDITWSFSVVDTTDPARPFKCGGQVVHDSVVTFVDPDSNGHYVKVCAWRDTLTGACLRKGDSVFVLEKPPGPHDGFPVFYSITYEKRNSPSEATYEDMYVAGRDTFDNYVRCGTRGDPSTCPIINVNHKLLNLTPAAGQPFVEPTGGPTPDLERVLVVPNPYRAREQWDRPGGNEIHFINLPAQASIKIFTVAGDLVAELQHNDPVRDFERWNLKNGRGQDVASGIYIYRVESTVKRQPFSFQHRFIVIR
jgi:hypothetical protein